MKFWRAESGYTHDRGTTALDVINYESEILGNKDIEESAQKLKIDFSKYSAKNIVWVAKTKKQASRYGEPYPYEMPENSVIVAKTEDNEFLILRGDASANI